MATTAHPATRYRWLPREEQRWRRLVNQAASDLSVLERDPRCRKPQFCTAFFDFCDGKILTEPKKSLDYAKAARKLADSTRDPHLINHSHVVLAHALLAREEYEDAFEVLIGNWAAAYACCPQCRTDWVQRAADVLIEAGRPDAALPVLDAVLEAKPAADSETPEADARGRILFLRGIAHHLLGDADRALADADATLQAISLRSPRGYFHDTIALIACFLVPAEPRHHHHALHVLAAFRSRIKGLKKWTEARRLLSWVEGLVLGRLGHQQPSMDRLERVREAQVESGPARYAVAITADLAQLYAGSVHESNLRAIRRVVGACLARRDLDPDHRRRLREVDALVRREPEQAAAITALRTSFIVPVPGLLAWKWLGQGAGTDHPSPTR